MSYRYLDHVADMGLEGEGETIEKAFAEAAKAMFGLMAEVDKLKPVEIVELKIEGEDLKDLFYKWMSELLAESSTKNLVFSGFCVDSVDKTGEGSYFLQGRAKGEDLNTSDADLFGEVKGVTFMGLAVEQKKGKWRARCVVDI